MPPIKIKKSAEPCQHTRLVPIEFGFAKVTYPNGYKNPPHLDFDASALYSNVLRVTRFMCVDCQTEVRAPSRKEL